jgi:hypothetical protein
MLPFHPLVAGRAGLALISYKFFSMPARNPLAGIWFKVAKYQQLFTGAAIFC